MGSITFPSATFSNKIFPILAQEKISRYSVHQRKKLYPRTNNIQLHQKYVSSVINLNQAVSFNYVSKSNGLLYPVKCNATDSSTPEDGQRAMETVQKLYKSLRNRNLNELSDIIGEECRCISNVVSTLQTFYGKEQVIAFFSSVINMLGNNIEFQIRPTMNDGTSVGVTWKLACSKTHVPLGKGYSFYICNEYNGKMIIRNVEIFMEPLLHIEPLRLKVSSYLLTTMEKMSPPELLKGKMKLAMKILFIVLLIAALLLLFQKL